MPARAGDRKYRPQSGPTASLNTVLARRPDSLSRWILHSHLGSGWCVQPLPDARHTGRRPMLSAVSTASPTYVIAVSSTNPTVYRRGLAYIYDGHRWRIDGEWAVSSSPLPGSCPEAGHGGHPGEHRCRDIVDVIRCLVKEGMGWRAIPVGTTCSMPVSGASERPRKA